MNFDARIICSLEKVFCRESLDADVLRETGGGRGEVVSFQIACRCENSVAVRIAAESELAEWIEIREVGYVPSRNPANRCDPYVLTSEPGLFPAPLLPCPGYIRLSPNHYHAFWVTVRIPRDGKAGRYGIRFTLDNQPLPIKWAQPQIHQELALDFQVYDFELPKQTLRAINWFHSDCILTWYGMTAWSEPYWAMLEKYFANMLGHGNNVLMTPLWTPPLDTAIGGERPTVQLLEISEANDGYRFDFGRLKRWLDTARRVGFEYFEFSHLFTQWGAACTPKIIVNGEKKFGWHVAADSAEYEAFLAALLPELERFLRGEGLAGHCYFHVSDEPQEADLAAYRHASGLVRKYLNTADFYLLDALSEPELARAAGLERPVPCTNALERFANEKTAERWVYYCGNWQDDVPNRSLGMPSERNRVLGVLLYLYRMDGFLHWGYNFWYSQYSLDTHLNPYQDSDAGGGFLGGDSFNVYPGAEGPVDALHFEVYREGLQDMRALQALEAKIGREATVRLIYEGVDYQLSMTMYPKDSAWLPALRRRVNEALSRA